MPLKTPCDGKLSTDLVKDGYQAGGIPQSTLDIIYPWINFDDSYALEWVWGLTSGSSRLIDEFLGATLILKVDRHQIMPVALIEHSRKSHPG